MSASDGHPRFDHIAITANALEDGVAWIEDKLGVPLAPGGRHPAMGTHNRLLSLGPDLYLEVITTDPEADAPSHARWFGLDAFDGAPCLHAWIIAVDEIADAPEIAGRPVALARGDLRWQMAVPETGLLAYDGCYPSMIAWGSGGHPTDKLPDVGVRLTELVVRHPAAPALQADLIGFADPRVRFETGDPGLRARFTTPNGTVDL